MIVDYIEGTVTNVREAMNKLIQRAEQSGAQEIQIQATVANEGLWTRLPRYGFSRSVGTSGYSDQFTRPLLVNQIPK